LPQRFTFADRVRAHAEVVGEPLPEHIGTVAAGLLYPVFGILLSPMLAGAMMSLSSV
jgi:hypothetical protein